MDPEQIPLRDLHLPEAIGWWPLAPGWWVLLGLAGLVLLLLFRKAWVRWREDAARRVALRELARVESTYHESPNPVLLATRLSELLRRTMLAYSPRKEVAGLTGLQWLLTKNHLPKDPGECSRSCLTGGPIPRRAQSMSTRCSKWFGYD